MKSERVTIQPYQHDCKNCIPVGWYTRRIDESPGYMYLCPSPKNPRRITVVIRYSSFPSDYWSTTVDLDHPQKPGALFGFIEMVDALRKREICGECSGVLCPGDNNCEKIHRSDSGIEEG